MNSIIETDIHAKAFLNISHIDMVFPTPTGGFTALKEVDLQIDNHSL